MTGEPLRNRRGHRWSVASLLLAVCASLALLFVPVLTTAETETFDVTSSGTPTVAYTEGMSQTLLQAGGAGAALFLLLPILITAAPVLLRNQAGVRAVRMAAAVLLIPILPTGYLTIGAFYLPSEIAMLAAARRPS